MAIKETETTLEFIGVGGYYVTTREGYEAVRSEAMSHGGLPWVRRTFKNRSECSIGNVGLKAAVIKLASFDNDPSDHATTTKG